MNEAEDGRGAASDGGTFERVGESLGGAAGRAMGRGSDLAADVFGSVLGSALDTLGEWWGSGNSERTARSFDESVDSRCRQHFESSVSADTGREYERVRPLYQFGYTAGKNPGNENRGFGEAEIDLQRAWGEECRQTYGDWPEVRRFVGFGYTQEGLDSVPDT